MGPRGTGGARFFVNALDKVAPRFTPGDRREKLRLLQRLDVTPIGQPEVLRRYHEALCYLQAYPDDPEVLALVDRALATWDRRIRQLSRRARARLRDSGIAGTVVAYPFGFAMARWLARRDPREVRIVWRGGEEGERLEETLAVLLTRAEGEAFTEGGPGWRRWIEVAAGGRSITALQFLVELFERAPLDPPTRDWLFEGLGLTLEWRLAPMGPSRTHARLPEAPRCFHGGTAAGGAALAVRTRRHLLGIVRQRVRLRPAAPALATTLIETARVAMATRGRELYAFSYPNPLDVLVADLEQGLRVALLGLPPESRLPLDAYYAFLVLKNGVPVSYGGGWYLFETLEIGFNVFESFRHGESAFIAGQVLRAYRQVFPARAVVVDRYQIGYDNDEALRSGAFYFYQRLGFLRSRPPRAAWPAPSRTASRATPGTARLQRSCGDSLRATSCSGLAAARCHPACAQVPWPPTERPHRSALCRGSTGGRPRRDAARSRRSGADGLPRRRGAEQSAFETFALLLDLVPDLEDWPVGDLRALLPLVQGKAGAQRARVRTPHGQPPASSCRPVDCGSALRSLSFLLTRLFSVSYCFSRC